MIIEPVCPKLFQVKDVLPNEYVEELTKLDWLNLPSEGSPLQEMMIRKRIKDEEIPLLSKLNILLEKHARQIGEVLNCEFKHIRTLWWLDLPGFTSGVHIDSIGCPSMQVYWVGPDTKYGTAFYSTNSFNPKPSTIIKDFEFIPNTGYLNDLTGSDSEKIYHGMLNKVPENTFRVSSYTQYFVK